MIRASLAGGKISSNDMEAHNLFSALRFGEKDSEKIFYSLPEALFLLENKKIEIFNLKDKKISAKKISREFQKIDKKFKIKFIVFRDLRKKGYIVKTALKFGAEFRVYEKGKKIGKDHAKWILFPVSETEQMTWQDFSAKNRIAHSTKKNLMIAIVDEENDVSYYDVSWVRT